MSVQTTPNLGLTLPYQTDPVAVSTQNDNMTIIDTAYGTLNSKIKAIENGVDNVSSSGSTIQFTGTHSSAPNVVATGADASGNPRFPVITGRTSTGFSVKVLDASGSSVGGYINWLAIW